MSERIRRGLLRHPFWPFLLLDVAGSALVLALGTPPLIVAILAFGGGWAAHQMWASQGEGGVRR